MRDICEIRNKKRNYININLVLFFCVIKNDRLPKYMDNINYQFTFVIDIQSSIIFSKNIIL